MLQKGTTYAVIIYELPVLLSPYGIILKEPISKKSNWPNNTRMSGMHMSNTTDSHQGLGSGNQAALSHDPDIDIFSTMHSEPTQSTCASHLGELLVARAPIREKTDPDHTAGAPGEPRVTRSQRGPDVGGPRPSAGISHNRGVGSLRFARLDMGLGSLKNGLAPMPVLGRPSPREAGGRDLSRVWFRELCCIELPADGLA